MSPFVSVSRRARRRRPSTSVLIVAIVASFVFAAPAFGGPSALSIAKKALKLATKANKPITSKRIVNGAVISNKIANGAVGTAKITNASVTNDKLAGGSVGTGKIANGAVGTVDLADGSVTNAKLADGSVGTAKIINGSVTLKDLAGTDFTGTYNISSVPANSCGVEALSVPGAQLGQFPILAFVGDAPLPTNLQITAIKVNATDSVRVKYCNPSNGATVAANGVQIRFITLS
jgi:uncharacterized low-complexity protein